MPETQVVHFILALAVGVIVLTIFFTGDIKGAIGNITQNKSIITVLGVAANAEHTTSDTSDYGRYKITTTLQMRIDPIPTEEIVVMPIITFKGASINGSEFKITAGENAVNRAVEFEVLSRYPPIKPIENGRNVFEFGNEYKVTSGNGGVFKLSMINIYIDADVLSLSSTCKAEFKVECKTGLETTKDLEECPSDIVNIRCSETIEKCGGSVKIIVRELNCPGKTAKVEINARDGAKWEDAGNTAVLRFFRKTPCVEKTLTRALSFGDIRFLNSECTRDFLGSYAFEITGL